MVLLFPSSLSPLLSCVCVIILYAVKRIKFNYFFLKKLILPCAVNTQPFTYKSTIRRNSDVGKITFYFLS